jgi:hypothetical protein
MEEKDVMKICLNCGRLTNIWVELLSERFCICSWECEAEYFKEKDESEYHEQGNS